MATPMRANSDTPMNTTEGGVINQYIITTIPVVLGTGTKLFGVTYADLEVVKSVTSPSWIVVATYRVR